MKPFWSYYGGKWRIAPHYPEPRYSTIVEPFAGAAGYSTRHHTREVLLLDKNPKIAALWSWLIKATPEDILSIPADLEQGQVLADLPCPEPAKTLIGLVLNPGGAAPRATKTKGWNGADFSGRHKMNTWSSAARARVAEQVPQIKHWTAAEGSYRDLPNAEVTWFIDPPYCGAAGRHYICGSKTIDYADLADWCSGLRGQVIVCEVQGADWLPFRPFGTFKANGSPKHSGKTAEAIWTNDSL